MLNKRYYLSSREWIIKRKVRIPKYCHECARMIISTEEYYEDVINYPEYKNSGIGYWLKYNHHIVCENCWKGVKLKA